MGHFFSKYLFFCFFCQKNISIFLEGKTKELNAILYISINSPLTVYAQFANVFMKKWSLNNFSKKKFFQKNFFFKNILFDEKILKLIIHNEHEILNSLYIMRKLTITDCLCTGWVVLWRGKED